MTDRLRILHAISSDRFAGVEQFVRRLAAQQAADGHEVTVVGGAEALMGSALREAGVAYSPGTHMRQVWSVVRRCRATIDVANSHMTAADAATVLAVSRSGPAVVATRHFAQIRGSRAPGVVYRRMERAIAAEISISHSVAAAIGVPSTVVYPGVVPQPAAATGSRQPIVLMAQRLQREKQSEVGLRGFAASGLAGRGWRLHIAGSGAERGELESLAGHLGIAPAVTFLGFRSDLPALLHDAGLFLATAPFEHFGLSVLEAMAAGLPVVASDAAGHSEMLSGLDERALYRPGDSDGAAERLRSLGTDELGRAKLGEAQRQRQTRDFTLRSQADGTEAVYRQAITARRRSP